MKIQFNSLADEIPYVMHIYIWRLSLPEGDYLVHNVGLNGTASMYICMLSILGEAYHSLSAFLPDTAN